MRKIVLIAAALSLVFAKPVQAAEEYHKMTLTCYTSTGNPTCTGIMPYEGIAAAKKEWVGKTVNVYTRDESMSLIGTYEIQDTGIGYNGSIKKGYVIDIYVEDLKDALPTQKVFVQIVEDI